MGLDLAFNKDQFIIAGGVIVTDTFTINAGEGYRASYCQVPKMEDWAECNYDNEQVVARANKWGRNYEPLTNFLHTNGITWSEF